MCINFRTFKWPVSGLVFEVEIHFDKLILDIQYTVGG